MASLRKLKGKWYVRIFFNGKEKIIPTYTKIKRDAEITLRKYKENEQEVKLRLTNHLLDSEMTIEKCIQFFNSNYKTEKGIAESTHKSYKNAVRDFEGCFTSNRSINSLQKSDFSLLVSYLKNRYHETTVNIRLRGIRLFLNYLLEKEMIQTLPFKVKQLKTAQSPPKMIPPHELELIYSQIDDPLLFSTYKAMEVTGMRADCFKNSRRDGEFIIVEKSKGLKKRIIPIPVEYIQDFDVAKARDYSKSWISRSFTKARKKAGFKTKITAHCLRHTFAYRKLLETDNLQLVRDLLGHSSIRMTEKYTQIPTDYLKQIFTEKNINTQNTFKTVGYA